MATDTQKLLSEVPFGTAVKWPNRIMWISFGLCALGIAMALFFRDASLGQRGGAFGVALSFAILFMGNSTAERALNSTVKDLSALADIGKEQLQQGADQFEAVTSRIESLEEETRQLRGSVSAMLDWANLEKRFLTISSVTSTLVWGFGDWVVRLLANLFGIAIN